MTQSVSAIDSQLYAQCIEVSKRVRWDIDNDVIRQREFDFSQKFLPDGLSGIDQLGFLTDAEKVFLSQIQGRTYANTFGLVERFITAKMLEISRDHWLGDQVALEALVRFCDEEIKHQNLFVRIERMMASGMPPGYQYLPQPNEVATAVLGKSTWAVLALIYQIEIFTQTHYKQSIKPDPGLSELYKDIFLFHAREEAQHAKLDALEWPRVDGKLSPEGRDSAVEDLIELVAAVDGILQAQAEADVGYFAQCCGRNVGPEERERIQAMVLRAYRWQYIFSGVEDPRFQTLIGGMLTAGQADRIGTALVTIRN